MGRKILFVIGQMGCGGAERVVANVANYLCDQGDAVALHHFQSKDYQSFYALDPRIRLFHIDYHTRKPRRLWDYVILFVKTVLSLRKVTKTTFKPDVIISVGASTNILVLLSTWGLKIPVIVRETIDLDVVFNNKNIFNKIREIFYLKAAAIVCLSHKMKNFFKNNLRKKIFLIPGGTRIDMVKKNWIPTKKIVSVSRLTFQKDMQTLIKAFFEFERYKPNYILTIYGDGDMRQELQKMIDNYGLRDKVTLAGNVHNPKSHYEDYDFFVTASRYEGVPNAVLEALSVGLPVLATDMSVTHIEGVKDNDNMLLVPVGDVKAMAEAMTQMVENQDLYNKIRTNGQKLLSFYDHDKIMSDWDCLINEVMKDG